MSKLIRFNHEMKWHLILDWQEKMGKREYARLTQRDLLSDQVTRLLDPYLFAFVDFKYDRNGYPYTIWGEKAVFKVSFNEYFDDDGKYAGTFIFGLHSRGAGRKSGLEVWDEIVELDGRKIKQGDLYYISETMTGKKSGDELPITVARRNGDGVVVKQLVLVAP